MRIGSGASSASALTQGGAKGALAPFSLDSSAPSSAATPYFGTGGAAVAASSSDKQSNAQGGAQVSIADARSAGAPVQASQASTGGLPPTAPNSTALGLVASAALAREQTQADLQVFHQLPKEQLRYAKDLLRTAIHRIESARKLNATFGVDNVADIVWDKDLYSEVEKASEAFLLPQDAGPDDSPFPSVTPAPGVKVTFGAEGAMQMDQSSGSLVESRLGLWDIVKDLVVEMLYSYHRISLRLVSLGVYSSVYNLRGTVEKHLYSYVHIEKQ